MYILRVKDKRARRSKPTLGGSRTLSFQTYLCDLVKSLLREFEYIRHGTQTLIANFDVVTGQVINPTCGDTRTEADEAAHVRITVENDPDASIWHFITDCLNTHQSESLVRLVIELEGLELDLDIIGIKGESGILKSMKTRTAFLSDPTQRKRLSLHTQTL